MTYAYKRDPDDGGLSLDGLEPLFSGQYTGPYLVEPEEVAAEDIRPIISRDDDDELVQKGHEKDVLIADLKWQLVNLTARHELLSEQLETNFAQFRRLEIQGKLKDETMKVIKKRSADMEEKAGELAMEASNLRINLLLTRQEAQDSRHEADELQKQVDSLRVALSEANRRWWHPIVRWLNRYQIIKATVS